MKGDSSDSLQTSKILSILIKILSYKKRGCSNIELKTQFDELNDSDKILQGKVNVVQLKRA